MEKLGRYHIQQVTTNEKLIFCTSLYDVLRTQYHFCDVLAKNIQTTSNHDATSDKHK